jgi:hypothetical protein
LFLGVALSGELNGSFADEVCFHGGWPNVRLSEANHRSSYHSRAEVKKGDGVFMSTIAARR